MTSKTVVAFILGAVWATSIFLAVFVNIDWFVFIVFSSIPVLGFSISKIVEHWDD